MELWLTLILLIVGTLRYRLFVPLLTCYKLMEAPPPPLILVICSKKQVCLLQRKQWDQVWELAATHPPPYIIMAANIIFCYDSRYPNDHSSTAPKFRLLWWPCKLNTHVHTVLHSDWCLLSSVPHSPCFTRDPSVCPGLLPPHYKISGHWCLRSCLRSPRSKFCWKYLLSWWAKERTTPAPAQHHGVIHSPDKYWHTCGTHPWVIEQIKNVYRKR